MARLARLVVPGLPHHVTQRGNGRARTFFSDADYAYYRDRLGEHCTAADVAVWGWVLMPNHVHLILVPKDEDGLRRALAPLHRRYAGHVHAREKRTGHFWQDRFGCVAMDDQHLAAALVYVAMNPVRARLTDTASGWRWSSVHAFLDPAIRDGVTDVEAVLERVPDLAERIAAGEDKVKSERLRKAESIGRPLGSAEFIARLERETGRRLMPGKSGPKPKARDDETGELSGLSP
jgi:putative transposase